MLWVRMKLFDTVKNNFNYVQFTNNFLYIDIRVELTYVYMLIGQCMYR